MSLMLMAYLNCRGKRGIDGRAERENNSAAKNANNMEWNQRNPMPAKFNLI